MKLQEKVRSPRRRGRCRVDGWVVAVVLIGLLSSCASGHRRAANADADRSGLARGAGGVGPATPAVPAGEDLVRLGVSFPSGVREGERGIAVLQVENRSPGPVVLLDVEAACALPGGSGWRRPEPGAWSWDEDAGGYVLGLSPKGRQPIVTEGLLGPGRSTTLLVPVRFSEGGLRRPRFGVTFVVVPTGPELASRLFLPEEDTAGRRLFRPASRAALDRASASTSGAGPAILAGEVIPERARLELDLLVKPAPFSRREAASRAELSPDGAIWSSWREAWVFPGDGNCSVVTQDAVARRKGVSLDVFETAEAGPEGVLFFAWTEALHDPRGQEVLAFLRGKYQGTGDLCLQFLVPRDEALGTVMYLAEKGLSCRRAEFQGLRGIGVFPP
ncbi:MAG: hypothetical protein HYZ53_14705 [Planctomycetes bacterium]|nr:hypothetical protein [Planctomycetota bacterium]